MVTDYDKARFLRSQRFVMLVAAVFCLTGVVTLVMDIDYFAFGLLVVFSIVAIVCALQCSADLRALELDISDVGRRSKRKSRMG